jgi:riboflavin transporter FmnP
MKIDTTTLAGTATLAALVVVFDYTMKYSNLKIPFPWWTDLKFDLTGIPIVLATLLFGLIPGTLTSAVAFVAILARSGNFVSSSMKGLAEFSTILGMVIGLKLCNRFRIFVSSALGVTSRILIMIVANLAFIYAGLLPFPSAYVNIPLLWALLISVFNVMQGVLSISGGYSVYEAIRRRAPSLIKKSNWQ